MECKFESKICSLGLQIAIVFPLEMLLSEALGQEARGWWLSPSPTVSCDLGTLVSHLSNRQVGLES